jgi:Fur family ferric uptake transcriptional regulator
MSCINTFREKGLKLTLQRKLIVDAIHSTKEHLTSEQIIAYVQNMDSSINKSTVYRTLQLLEEAGCIYKSELAGHLIYHHSEEGHHHHLVCKKCGKITDCEENIFKPVEQLLREKYSFHVDLKHLIIQGICGECKQEEYTG